MDKVTLANMKFFGYHGCEEAEKRNGQVFAVDAEILLNLSVAGKTDCLNDAVNYVEIYENIKSVMENERYDLLERVAERLTERILEDIRVAGVILRIRKPGVPLSGILDWVQIEIRRDRNS